MSKGAQPGVSAHASFSIMSGSFPGICVYRGISNQTVHSTHLTRNMGLVHVQPYGTAHFNSSIMSCFIRTLILFTFKEADQQTSVLFTESQQKQ